MGLIKEGDDFSVLSDILGDEDHLGDMDFKVAGTKDGITSLQMDIKITGITFEIMERTVVCGPPDANTYQNLQRAHTHAPVSTFSGPNRF